MDKVSRDGGGNGRRGKRVLPSLPPKKEPRYKAQQVIDAVEKAKGTVSQAARLLRCTPMTLRNYAKRYPSVAQAIREQREAMTDTAELKLYEAILKGEAWSVCFYLKTQGKERGYVERVEHTGEGGLPLEVTFRIAAPPRDDVLALPEGGSSGETDGATVD